VQPGGGIIGGGYGDEAWLTREMDAAGEARVLGADGVLVGTRFYASQEAAGLPAAKDRIVAATGDRTVRSILFDIARRNVWPAPYTGRVLQNNFSEKWSGRETELLQRQEEEATSYAAARAGADFDTAAVIAGEVVDLIADVPPAAEVVERMMTGATQLLAGASNTYRITTG
jgi:nitronate monooxygenase